MWRIMRSELLKMRHTFSMKLMIIAPLITVLLGYILSGTSVQYSAYNWWYTMILPLVISLWAASTIVREKKTGMQNIVCLPIRSDRVWAGKAFSIVLLLSVSSLLMWAVTTVIGLCTVMYISPIDGLIGCFLLLLSYLWQIPFTMFLASQLGYIGSILVSFAGNMLFSFLGAETNWFFLNPYAISSRIVCPFFKMQPNGIPLENNSALLETGYVLPAITISLLFAVAVLWGSSKLFLQGENCHD